MKVEGNQGSGKTKIHVKIRLESPKPDYGSNIFLKDRENNLFSLETYF